MKECFYASWYRWGLKVDPLEYKPKELDKIIEETTLVAWYFGRIPSIGLRYIDKTLKFKDALTYAKAYEETCKVIKEHGGNAGDA